MAALYLFYYFGKKNLGAATGTILETFDFTKQQFGGVMTAFTLTYALGQFVNGFLGDRYSPKWVMIVGALGGVVANLSFGFSSTLLWFILFWAINGYFSSMGWAPGCRILCNWFPEKRWGWWMGLYNFFPYFGGALVAPVAAWCIGQWGWRSAFWGPPICLLIMAVIYVWLGRSSPEKAGVEVTWKDPDEFEPTVPLNGRDYWRAFKSRRMFMPYLVALGANGIRFGLINWCILYLETPAQEGGLELPLQRAALLGGSMVDWGGMFFAVALGVLSDRLYSSQRRQTIVISLWGAAVALLVLSFGSSYAHIPYTGPVVLGLAVFIAGGLIQGMHTPLFCLPGDILGQQHAGTGAGIMDGWMYIGAALAGAPLGWWLDTYGLASGIQLLAVCCLVFGLLAWGIKR